jgi:hypothetical protein
MIAGWGPDGGVSQIKYKLLIYIEIREVCRRGLSSLGKKFGGSQAGVVVFGHHHEATA